MPNRIFTSLALLGLMTCAISLPNFAVADEEADQGPRLLLAHYMPCFPPVTNLEPASSFGYQGQFDPNLNKANGNLSAKPLYTVDPKDPDAVHKAFVAEIKIAKAAGLDGFLVDELWDQDSYRNNWLALLKAAEEVGGFYIGLTPDEACLGCPSDKPKPDAKPGDKSMYDQVYDWLKVAEKSPALLRYKGKPVLAPYGVDWGNVKPYYAGHGSAQLEHGLCDWLAAKGMPVSYIPDHSLDSGACTNSDENDPKNGFQTFSVGQASFTPSASRALRDRALAYWPPSQLIMGEVAICYYNRGWSYTAPRESTKYRDEWMWNIQHRDRVHWVQIITWNDLGETAIEPTNNHFNSYLTLTRYYSDWFKTGHQPAIAHDSLYLFHRASPYDVVPTVSTYKVKSWHPADEIEALAFLSAPATVVVHTGNSTQERKYDAGIHSFIVPFQLGVQSAEIKRDGQAVTQVTSPIPINDKPSRENLWFVAADSNNPPRALPMNDWTNDKGSWAGAGSSRSGSGLSLTGNDSNWEDYSLSATFAPGKDAAGLVARATAKGQYQFTVTSDPAGLKWQIAREDGTTETVLDSGVASANASEPVHLRLNCVGEHIIGFVNDQLVSSTVYDYTYPIGRAGIIATGSPVAFLKLQAESYDPVMQESQVASSSEKSPAPVAASAPAANSATIP